MNRRWRCMASSRGLIYARFVSAPLRLPSSSLRAQAPVSVVSSARTNTTPRAEPMASSSRSTSSSSASLATDMSSSSRKPSAIAALPSFTHSLSSFPTMTAVTSDMVYYGTHSRTKQASEAKLNTALQATRQKMPGSPRSPLSTPTSPLDDPLDWPEDDEGALVIPRRRSKGYSNKNGL